jgi:hypothetical protein
MKWFWRIVCSPGCTTFCKRLCPGCQVMGAEWQELGVAQPEGSLPRFPFAWSRLKLRWIYYARLFERQRGKFYPESASACGPDCGCQPASSVLATQPETNTALQNGAAKPAGADVTGKTAG